MNFPQRNNFLGHDRRNSSHKTWWILGIFVVVFLLFTFTGLRGALVWVAKPIWKAENSLILFWQDSFELLSAKKTLVEENRKLKETLLKTDYYILARDFLRSENDDLKEALGRKSVSRQSVLAYVLVKPGKTPYDQIIIDAGENFGVAVGDLILAEGSVAVGEVIEVFGSTAKVSLYSSPNRKLTVLIGPNAVQADAEGLGGGNFRVRLPKETGIKEGENIIIPSISNNVFGVIEKIESSDTDTFQDIYFKSPVNISELRLVEVVKGLGNKK
ncbi:MAG: rod shape-determining protein MreC [bacterium]